MNGKKERQPSVREELFFLLMKIGIVAALAAVLFYFVFGVCRCSDDSMAPAFRNGDLVFYYRLQKEYQPADAVVLWKDGERQVRRIVAKAGDTVEITEDGLKVNGHLQQEKTIYTETLPYVGGISFPVILGKGEYFVLGDDRKNAKDSRIYGVIRQEEIKGAVMTILRRRGF